MSPVLIVPSEKQKQSAFAKLLEKQESENVLEEGELVQGRVVRITRDAVVIDVQLKSEGQIPIEEFTEPDGTLTVREGETIEVLLESVEDENGSISLSKRRADTFKAWDSLVKIYDENGTVEGFVVKKVKGGLTVDVGVRAFLPGSQLDVRPVRNLDKFVGKKIRCKILKMNKKRGNVVLSRKALAEVERDSIKEEVLKNLKEGQVLDGTVKNVTAYGTFLVL